MNSKYAKDHSNLKNNGHQSLKSDEMCFWLHKANYGGKMPVDFKWSFPRNLSLNLWLNWRFYVNSNNFWNFNRNWFTADKQGKFIAGANAKWLRLQNENWICWLQRKLSENLGNGTAREILFLSIDMYLNYGLTEYFTFIIQITFGILNYGWSKVNFIAWQTRSEIRKAEFADIKWRFPKSWGMVRPGKY